MLNIPEYLIVHHTGGTKENPLADTSHHTFEQVKKYHIEGRKFEDIGYHYFIEKTGKLFVGRAENYHGAHALGYNTKSLGICLAGNFDLTLPTQEQINTLKQWLQEKRIKHNIALEKIVPHRKFINKTCYGKNLPDDWARTLVQEDTIKKQLLAALDGVKNLVNNLYS